MSERQTAPRLVGGLQLADVGQHSSRNAADVSGPGSLPAPFSIRQGAEVAYRGGRSQTTSGNALELSPNS
jgi:hypothetical protein